MFRNKEGKKKLTKLFSSINIKSSKNKLTKERKRERVE